MCPKVNIKIYHVRVKRAFIKKTENYMQWNDHVLLVLLCGGNQEWSGHYIWCICLFD